MTISEVKDTMHVSDLLVVGYDAGKDNDVPCLAIGRVADEDDSVKCIILKCVHGTIATRMYEQLTKQKDISV